LALTAVTDSPHDPFNSLLSLGYTVLYAHVETVLRVSGLLPWIGFYHQAHGCHAALASDLMEPFRHLVERTALAAVTRGSIVPEDFYLDTLVRTQKFFEKGKAPPPLIEN
jgi:CRISPR-associated endonuclease Cas1